MTALLGMPWQDLLPWIVVIIVYVGETIKQVVLTSVLRNALDKAQTAAHAPAVVPAPVPPSAPKPAPAPAPTPPVAHPAPLPPKSPTEYDRMWSAMQVLPQHQAGIDRDAQKIFANKARYEGVAQQTGVPWFVIGLVDQMEAGAGCKAHLHNGDPLDGRTIHVPAGRPPAPLEPPFTWEQSALDALHYEKFDQVKDWSLSGVASALERYNGMGYHNKGVPSPYLWSFSNQYHSGKFVADHVFDPNAVSEQAGAMTILKALLALDPSIQL
jgi:lysozyme family protein